MRTQHPLPEHAVPPNGVPPKTVWVASPPKTGSTWLSILLQRSLRFVNMSMLPKGFGRRDQELVVPQRYKLSHHNVFMPHHHTKASELTLAFIKQYHVYVIVLRRRILDIAISLVDHLTNDGVVVPVGYIPMAFKTQSFEERCAIVARLLMPWYMSFYASWAYAALEQDTHILFLNYEDLVRDPKEQLARCLTFAGEVRNVNVYNTAIAKTKTTETRFNKGVIGRGRRELPAAIQQQIIELLSLHSDKVVHDALMLLADPQENVIDYEQSVIDQSQSSVG